MHRRRWVDIGDRSIGDRRENNKTKYRRGKKYYNKCNYEERREQNSNTDSERGSEGEDEW